MKRCVDANHEGERDLPLTEFYFNHTTNDGRSPYCIPCTKRRSAADQERRRAVRRAQGLIVNEFYYKRSMELGGEGRHQRKRKRNGTLCNLQRVELES